MGPLPTTPFAFALDAPMTKVIVENWNVQTLRARNIESPDDGMTMVCTGVFRWNGNFTQGDVRQVNHYGTEPVSLVDSPSGQCTLSAGQFGFNKNSLVQTDFAAPTALMLDGLNINWFSNLLLEEVGDSCTFYFYTNNKGWTLSAPVDPNIFIHGSPKPDNGPVVPVVFYRKIDGLHVFY